MNASVHLHAHSITGRILPYPRRFLRIWRSRPGWAIINEVDATNLRLPRETHAAPMENISDKLKELIATKGLMTGTDLSRQRESLARQRLAGEFEIEQCVPGELVHEDAGPFYLVRRDLPLDSRQGGIALGAVLEAIPEHIALSACDPELDAFDPSTAVFMDAETTGLAGGTGTVAFLVGVGYFTEDAFRLDQCFLRDFDEEEAMLQYLDHVFARGETVVTFNGKTFDIPLLRTRFVANRQPFRLDGAMHFDLIHAVRRIWKLRLKDCSLSHVERAVLGIQRQGDVPSAEIPQIWFDYLRTRDARDLKRVFYHHRMDILSLVALTALLSQCLDVPQGRGFEHAEDRLSLVRLHFRQKRFEDAVSHAKQLLETQTEPFIRRECFELLGFASKRVQDWTTMENTWRRMACEFPSDLLCRLELAKHHEHRTRNLAEAERICVEALERLETRAVRDPEDELETLQGRAFQRRLERICRKLSRAGIDDGLEHA